MSSFRMLRTPEGSDAVNLPPPFYPRTTRHVECPIIFNQTSRNDEKSAVTARNEAVSKIALSLVPRDSQ